MLRRTTSSRDKQAIAANRLFSPGVLSKIAKNRGFDEFVSLCNQTGFNYGLETNAVIADAFDFAFAKLRKSGVRSEYIYKSALTHNVLLGMHSLSTASIATEFRVGKSKADVVIFNGTSTAYEIKSDRDNLSRLMGQIADYRKVFARNFVICSPSHLQEVEAELPSDVGILLLSRWNRISTHREARSDFSNFCAHTMFSSLATSDAREVLKRCGVGVPQVPNTRLRRVMWDEFSDLDVQELHHAMVHVLKSSHSKQCLKSILQSFPKSVMPAVVNMRLRRLERENLSEAMRKPFASL